MPIALKFGTRGRRGGPAARGRDAGSHRDAGGSGRDDVVELVGAAPGRGHLT